MRKHVDKIFGQVDNAFIRVVNEETGAEVVRFDLGEDYSVETAMVFGEIYRHNGEWKFRAVGQGYSRWVGSNVPPVRYQYLTQRFTTTRCAKRSGEPGFFCGRDWLSVWVVWWLSKATCSV